MQLRTKSKRSLILNITSLIDVLFLLLIFFMISTTFLSTPAIKLELPKAVNADAVRQEPLVIYVDVDGTIFLNDEPMAAGLLATALKDKLQELDDKAVVLKADSRVTHGRVVEIMDIVKGAGVRRLTVSTQPQD
jgi:biopolymer transport protein ExbD